MLLLKSNIFFTVHDNNVDPFIPEWWANESLAILEENMVAANLVYRDFEPMLAKYGDVVNTRKPGEFVAKRKTNADSVTVQDITATNIPVPLDQHIHVSFLIKDGEESKSFKDLVQEYMHPAMLAQARIIDQIVLGQYPQFLANAVGQIGGLITSTNAKDALLDLRLKLNQNKAYMDGRNLVLNPVTESLLLHLDIFTQAQQVGDQGQALREAFLGRKFGLKMFMDQNMASVLTGNTTYAAAVNNAAGYPVGATSLTVDGTTGAISVGEWFWIATDAVPYRVKTHTETMGNTTTITIDAPGLRHAVLDNAVITAYAPGAVNNVAGYAAGYAKEITIDGTTVAPQVGQFVSFGTGSSVSDVYTIIQVNALVGITLDRPLKVALANDDTVNFGPPGNYNFCFHRNAIALVVRPLAMPKAGTGALSAVVNMNNLSMRATITYDGNKQGHLVTLDMLCGIAVLEPLLGAVLLT